MCRDNRSRLSNAKISELMTIKLNHENVELFKKNYGIKKYFKEDGNRNLIGVNDVDPPVEDVYSIPVNFREIEGDSDTEEE